MSHSEPGRGFPWAAVCVAAAAAALGFRFRTELETAYRAHLAYYVNAGGLEAKSSGKELLYESGALERPQAPLPKEIPADRLAPPEGYHRTRGRPEDAWAFAATAAAAPRGKRSYLEDFRSFWASPSGIGTRWSLGLGMFFFILGTVLFRGETRFKQASAKRGKWR